MALTGTHVAGDANHVTDHNLIDTALSVVVKTVNGTAPDIAGNVVVAAGGAVTSVAGRTGAVVLAGADVSGVVRTVNSTAPDGAGNVVVTGAVPLSVAGQIPQPDGTAAIGSVSAAARTDHVHPVAGLIEWFGDALDGDLAFNGSAVTMVATVPGDTITSTMTATANVYTLVRDLYCRNLTVAATYTLYTAGCRVFATGAVTVNGTISHGGRNAVVAAGGAATTTGGLQTSLAIGGAGASGGTGVGSQGGSPQYFPSSYGNGAGGSGGAGAGGAINTGGGAPYSSSPMRTTPHQAASAFFGTVSFYNTNNVYAANNTSVQFIEGGRGGSSGAGDATNSGGGGGGAGGVCIVNARYLTGSGSINANGGNGGIVTVGNCGGGGGASGGVCFVNTADAAGTVSGLPAWTGTVTAAGGAGGAGVGTGTAGGAGSAGLSFLTTWK